MHQNQNHLLPPPPIAIPLPPDTTYADHAKARRRNHQLMAIGLSAFFLTLVLVCGILGCVVWTTLKDKSQQAKWNDPVATLPASLSKVLPFTGNEQELIGKWRLVDNKKGPAEWYVVFRRDHSMSVNDGSLIMWRLRDGMLELQAGAGIWNAVPFSWIERNRIELWKMSLERVND